MINQIKKNIEAIWIEYQAIEIEMNKSFQQEKLQDYQYYWGYITALAEIARSLEDLLENI